MVVVDERWSEAPVRPAPPTSFDRQPPQDLAATIFHCLGYPPETEMRDALNRPLPISRGRVIEAVVEGLSKP